MNPIEAGFGMVMQRSVPDGVGQALSILKKDLRAELRNRAALNAIVLFAITALVVVGLALGPGRLEPVFKAALLWVVLFFAAFSGMAHVFQHEEETNTSFALRLCASPGSVYAGKLLFNLLLLAGIALLIVPLYVLMLDVAVVRPLSFVAAIGIGSIGLSSAATIVGAIIARAKGKGALYGALGFPILLPLLVIAVDATRLTLSREPPEGLRNDLIGLAAFAIMLITVSAMLFPSIWEE